MTADAEGWLPWAEAAEQSVLGALLMDNDAMGSVAGLLDARSFWHAPHRAIFGTIARLLSAGQPADVVTVFEALREAAQADDCGGLAYLNTLAQAVPGSANVRRYAAIVADKALRRAILAAVDGAAQTVREAASGDEALDRVQSSIADVKRLDAGSDPKPMCALMPARVAHWQALSSGDELPAIPTGLAAVDEALYGGIRRGHVFVLAARPGVGKTSLAMQILLNVAVQGHAGLMCSQEMKGGELLDRVAANLGRVPLGSLSTGRIDDRDAGRLADAADLASSLPVYIDDQPALSLLAIRAKARKVKREAGGLAILVIDYLQLCNGAGVAKTRHHELEALSRGIKALAKELDVCVLLLSQLNRASENDEPELHHLKESGAIEEDADAVMLLHPWASEADGTVTVLAKLAKNRNGRRGRLALSFDGRTQTWSHSTANVSRRA